MDIGGRIKKLDMRIAELAEVNDSYLFKIHHPVEKNGNIWKGRIEINEYDEWLIISRKAIAEEIRQENGKTLIPFIPGKGINAKQQLKNGKRNEHIQEERDHEIE